MGRSVNYIKYNVALDGDNVILLLYYIVYRPFILIKPYVQNAVLRKTQNKVLIHCIMEVHLEITIIDVLTVTTIQDL